MKPHATVVLKNTIKCMEIMQEKSANKTLKLQEKSAS